MAQLITKLVKRMRQRFETLYGSFFFVRIPVDAVKKNSTQFLQKFTAFSAFNAKRCGRFAVKKVFSPLFTANLTLFFVKTSTRATVVSILTDPVLSVVKYC